MEERTGRAGVGFDGRGVADAGTMNAGSAPERDGHAKSAGAAAVNSAKGFPFKVAATLDTFPARTRRVDVNGQFRTSPAVNVPSNLTALSKRCV